MKGIQLSGYFSRIKRETKEISYKKRDVVVKRTLEERKIINSRDLPQSILTYDVMHEVRKMKPSIVAITYRSIDLLNNKYFSRVIALNTSKAFDKVWQRELLQKFSSYGITRGVFLIINTYLVGMSLKVVVTS